MMTKLKYFKRSIMELELRQPVAVTRLAPHYHLIPWHDSYLQLHARVKAECFENELDAVIMPSLGSLSGCRELMLGIRYGKGFCPAATWLMFYQHKAVGTIQGVIRSSREGAIQNLGVLPEYRGQGIGKALLLRALAGFQKARVRRVCLEVTATNHGAIQLYRKVGFRSRRTIYKAAMVLEPVGAK